MVVLYCWRFYFQAKLLLELLFVLDMLYNRNFDYGLTDSGIEIAQGSFSEGLVLKLSWKGNLSSLNIDLNFR